MKKYYALDADGDIRFVGEFENIDGAFDSSYGLSAFYVGDEEWAYGLYENLKKEFGQQDASQT